MIEMLLDLPPVEAPKPPVPVLPPPNKLVLVFALLVAPNGELVEAPKPVVCNKLDENAMIVCCSEELQNVKDKEAAKKLKGFL